MQTPKQCILLFVRAPERGRVKTRLAASLGDEAALELYRYFVLDMMDMLARTGHRVIICGHPQEKMNEIKTWLGSHHTCLPQIGNSLGHKMANAFSTTFSEGFERIVLIGSDIPDMPSRILHQAFSALDREGAALGPALDGGYYLVAFQKAAFLPEIFENISWGTEKVLGQTLSVFKKNNAPVRLLEPRQDIDNIEDLEALLDRHPADNSPAPATLAYLRRRRRVGG